MLIEQTSFMHVTIEIIYSSLNTLGVLFGEAACGISSRNEHFDTAQCTWLEVCNVSHSPVYVYNILSLTTMDKPRGTKACGISLLN